MGSTKPEFLLEGVAGPASGAVMNIGDLGAFRTMTWDEAEATSWLSLDQRMALASSPNVKYRGRASSVGLG